MLISLLDACVRGGEARLATLRAPRGPGHWQVKVGAVGAANHDFHTIPAIPPRA